MNPRRQPSHSDQDLAGRIAIITGAESGIGAACSAELAEAGADIAVLYFNDANAAQATQSAVSSTGRRSLAVQVDVASEHSVEAGFDTIAAELGEASILINSAGLNQSATSVADMDLAQWNRLLATDLTGAFLTCRRFVRDLRKSSRPGAILNISSIHAFVVRSGAADYDAAKAGLANLTRTLALETARLGITVNAIAPGMILTPMNSRAVADEAYRRQLEASIPLGRAGAPEESPGSRAIWSLPRPPTSPAPP